MAFQKNPYPILWCVRSDGALASLTLEESNEIIGWCIHEFDGDVESVAVIPGTNEDEIWITVERTINDATYRYIEQLQPFDWGTDQEDCFYVDSGLSFDGGTAITVTGVTQANPGVVTATTHGFSDGDNVRIYDVNGMTLLNHQVFTVEYIDADSFSLRDMLDEVDIDTRGMIAHWKMDDNATTTTVEDIYGHNGMAYMNTDEITADGAIGSSLSFNVPSPEGIIVSDHNDFSFGNATTDVPFSLSLWCKSSNFTSEHLIEKNDTYHEWLLFVDSDDFTFFLYDQSAYPAMIGKVSTGDQAASTDWVHVVVTYDGSTSYDGLNMFINGDDTVDVNTSFGSYTAMENTAEDVHISGQGGTTANPLYLDDVRISNKELTYVDIDVLYNNYDGTDKPIGYCQYIDGGYVRQCENTFTTLTHLEGKTVAVLQDGGDAGTQTVTSGTITTDDFYYVVHAGLPFTSKILPMKLELSGQPGALFGVTKRITDVTVRLYATSGCDIGVSWDDYDSVVFHNVNDPLDVAPSLFTGDKKISFSGPYETAGNIYIQSDVPLPMTLLALMSNFEVSD